MSQKKITYQFSESGKLLNTFPSVKAAAIELKLDAAAIASCARKERASVDGYVFSYEPEFSPAPKKTNRRKVTYQFSESGKLLNTFPSVKAAAKTLKIDASAISMCAIGKKKTCKGYIFRYSK